MLIHLFTCLFIGKAVWQREERHIFQVVNFPNGFHCQGWWNQNPGISNFILLPHMTLYLGHFLMASPSALAGIWMSPGSSRSYNRAAAAWTSMWIWNFRVTVSQRNASTTYDLESSVFSNGNYKFLFDAVKKELLEFSKLV